MWGIPDEETDQYFMIFAIRDIGINGAVVREKEKIPDDYPSLRTVSRNAIGKLWSKQGSCSVWRPEIQLRG